MVHGWFFKPHNFDAKKTYPLAFLIHGGPEGAWNDDWGLRWNQQIFSGAGYAVVSINPTGSTGYGSEFTRAILRNWGSLPYQGI
jgi:dipeptidyl aminopeptidase/acylaminoacyl peptidase